MGPGVGPGGGAGAGVFDTYPHDGATGVNPNSDLLVEFSAPMNNSSVKTTFTPALSGVGPIWDGNFMDIARGFNVSFAANTHYSVTVTGQTQAGASVLHTFSFTTAPAAVVTTVPPTVLSTTPPNGATGVDPMSHVVYHFSAPIRFSTVHPDPGLGAMTWNAAGDVLDFAPPAGGFVRGDQPSISVHGTDYSWNGLSAPAVSFSIPEITAPLQILGMSPASGSSMNIPTNAPISLSFSRDMEPTSTVAALTVSSGPCTPQSQWINPRMYRCVPSTPAAGTTVTVSVGTGAKDTAGNPLPVAWSGSFTVASVTNNTAPTLVSFTPPDGATGVTNGTPIVINFSKSMDRGTVEQHFRMPLNSLTGRFQWNATNTQATFTPTQAFWSGETIQWTADSSQDLYGNSVYEFPLQHQFSAIQAMGEDLSPPARQAVTMGTLGSRSDALHLLLVGDDARNQGTDVFLNFDLSQLQAAAPKATVRQAYLILSRVGCEGSVANLGGTLLVEGIAAGSSIVSTDLTSSAVGTTYQAQNVCAGPSEIFIPVTEKIRADFAAVPTQGSLTHFRLRFAQATNNDGSPDRLVLDVPSLQTLRVVWESN